jgi:hypothetical protein
MALPQKQYYYKVYNTSLVYLTTWVGDVVSEPTFRTVINGGPGELKVRLARSYDNFGEGVDVSLNNRIELWVTDGDNLSNTASSMTLWNSAQWDTDVWDYPALPYTKLYSGYISAYAPVIDGNSQYVDVTVLGFVTDATNYILKDASGNTKLTYTAQDPGAILKDMIDKYRTAGGINLQYVGSSVQLTNTSVTYTFSHMTLKDAMDKVISLCPYGWYWFVDTTGTVYLQSANIAAATHILTLGRDVSFSQTTKRSEGVVNEVSVIGGGNPNLFNLYQRSGSITTYGMHHQTIQDGQVTDNTTADALAKRVLDTFQTPETRTVIRVIDNNEGDTNIGANIEAFIVGDTIQLKNLNANTQTDVLWDLAKWDSNVWDYTINSTTASILTIVSISYNPQYIEIEASSRLPEITKDLQAINQIVTQQAQENLPTAPTIRSV